MIRIRRLIIKDECVSDVLYTQNAYKEENSLRISKWKIYKCLEREIWVPLLKCNKVTIGSLRNVY